MLAFTSSRVDSRADIRAYDLWLILLLISNVLIVNHTFQTSLYFYWVAYPLRSHDKHLASRAANFLDGVVQWRSATLSPRMALNAADIFNNCVRPGEAGMDAPPSETGGKPTSNF